MPGRILPLAVGEIYHVINRGISGQQVFVGERCLERAWQTLLYYRYQAVPLSISELVDLPAEARASVLNKLAEENKLMTEMIACCLMPDHFHFLLRQVQEGGISTGASFPREIQSGARRNRGTIVARFSLYSLESPNFRSGERLGGPRGLFLLFFARIFKVRI